MREPSERARRLSQGACVIVLFLSAYDLAQMQLSMMAAVALIVWAVILRPRVSRGLNLLVALTSPVVVVPMATAATTAAAYHAGKAWLPGTGGGYPGPEAYNLDSTYRVFTTVHSCALPSIGDVAVQIVRQLSFESLFALFGPPRNAYLGPYPEKSAAFEWLDEHGMLVDAAAWSAHALPGIAIPPGLFDRARSRGLVVPPGQPVRVAVMLDSCLLVGTEDDRLGRNLHLIDLAGFGWFAMYHRSSNIPYEEHSPETENDRRYKPGEWLLHPR
jgi:hypothetical protein